MEEENAEAVGNSKNVRSKGEKSSNIAKGSKIGECPKVSTSGLRVCIFDVNLSTSVF